MISKKFSNPIESNISNGPLDQLNPNLHSFVYIIIFISDLRYQRGSIFNYFFYNRPCIFSILIFSINKFNKSIFLICNIYFFEGEYLFVSKFRASSVFVICFINSIKTTLSFSTCITGSISFLIIGISFETL